MGGAEEEGGCQREMRGGKGGKEQSLDEEEQKGEEEEESGLAQEAWSARTRFPWRAAAGPRPTFCAASAAFEELCSASSCSLGTRRRPNKQGHHAPAATALRGINEGAQGIAGLGWAAPKRP